MELAHSKTISSVIQSVILDYAKMARTGEAPPETFVSSCCGLRLHQLLNWVVRTEFPARDCAALGIDRNTLNGLSKNFRIDIMAFSKDYTRGDRTVEALIEFKLWTSVDKIRIDIDRLRLLSKAMPPQNRRPEAYVVCLPHYGTMEKVADALQELSQRFKLVDVGEAGNRPFSTQDGSDRSNGPAAAVAIINANDGYVMRV